MTSTSDTTGFVKVGKPMADAEDVFAENVRLYRQIFRLQERLAKLMLERRQEGNARRELKRIAKRLLKFAE